MSQSAIRLLSLSICATALMMVPTVTPVSAKTGHHEHAKLHRSHSHGFNYDRPAGQAWPVTRPSIPAGQVCPGIGRSFDCKIWPPPFDDDPDRKMSGSDG